MDINFKNNESFSQYQNQNQNQNHRFNIDSGSESAFMGSWSSSSSSSFLNTSFESELDSNEADLIERGNGDDNDEFMDELTRKMTDYMLEENADSSEKSKFQEQNHNQNQQKNQWMSYADTVKKSISLADEKQLPPPTIQLYKVENQPKVEVQSNKGKINESSTQHVKHLRHEQIHSNRGGVYGSGMRAIFLGGPGSRNVVSGTGVFLPRSPSDATDNTRKKSGCSTVLVPTRVLQALEQHFHNMESLSPSNRTPRTHRHSQVKKEKPQTQTQETERQDSKLPQEWIY